MTNRTAAGQPTGPSVVSVLGMHRSGTSLVSRVLSLLGYYLGPDEQMMPPNIYNQEGYWEHLGLTGLNDEILRRLGGAWDRPASESMDGRDPRLADLADAARALLKRDFEGKAFWAWKDPRSSLTLPFWQAIVPEMRYVICVRNPQEVAASLLKRDQLWVAPEQGLDLWFTYTAAAIENSAGGDRIFTFYEDWLENPGQELARLAAFIRRPLPRKATRPYRQITGVIKEELRHNETGLINLLDSAQVEGRIKSLYFALRLLNAERADDEGGVRDELDRALTVFARRLGNEYKTSKDRHSALVQSLNEQSSHLSAREQELQLTQDLISAQRNEIELVRQLLTVREDALLQTSTKLEALQRDLAERSERLADLASRALAQEEELARLSSELLARDAALDEAKSAAAIDYAELLQRATDLCDAESMLERVSAELGEIRSRPGFQALEGARRLAMRLAPWGSLRARVAATLVRGAAYFMNRGPFAFFLRLCQPWKWLPRLLQGDPKPRPAPLVGPNRFVAAFHRARQYRRYAGWRGFFRRLVHVSRWAPRLVTGRRPSLDSQSVQANEPAPISPRKGIRVGCFAEHAWNVGGGTVYAIQLLQPLARFYDVDLLIHPDLPLRSPQWYSENFSLDISDIQVKHYTAGIEDSYDIWISIWNESIWPAKTGKRFNVVFFPFVVQDGSGFTHITCSEYSAGYVKQLYKTNDVAVIYPYIDPAEFSSSSKEPLILHVSRFTRPSSYADKAHGQMVEAFRRLHERGMGGWRLTLAGATLDEDEAAYADSLVKKATGLPVEIKLNPTADELRELYRQAAIYWHATGLSITVPAAQEHFGISILEAMASSAIPISYNSGGPREIISDGVDGFLFDSIEGLVEKTWTAATQPDLWQRVSRAALDRARYFSKERLESLVLSTISKTDKVSIIVGSNNNLPYLKGMLDSLFRFTPPGFELIVVDNACSDGTAIHLASIDYPHLKVIKNETNEGFAEFNNRGLAVATRPYILYINDDVELTPGWLEPLVEMLDSHERVGAVGARLLYGDGRVQHDGMMFRARDCKTYHVNIGGQPDDDDGPVEVDAITGACLMVRRELAGFSADYERGYYEDVDLCLRIKEQGYGLVLQRASTFTHFQGVSMGRDQRATELAQEKNYQLLMQRWREKLPGLVHLATDEEVARGGLLSRKVLPSETLSHSWPWFPRHVEREVSSDWLHCNVCGFTGRFGLRPELSEHMRENLSCPKCGAISRDRFMAAVISSCLNKLPVLADWPVDKSVRIREPSAYRGRAALLSEKVSYLPSEYPQVNLEALPDADGSIDHMITSDVFEHVRDDEAAFKEIYRVLKPGGFFFLQVPYRHNSKTEIRVRPEGDKEIFLAPPLYHEEQSLVYRIYGNDALDRLGKLGFAAGYVHGELQEFGISHQDMIVCRKGAGLPFISEPVFDCSWLPRASTPTAAGRGGRITTSLPDA